MFLDEIGDIPIALQTRLLRVLSGGEFYRVGGRELIRVDVGVIAATHQDLERRVARGEFRVDLLHRLDVVRLEIPPLRARRGDIPLLAQRFLDRAGRAAGFDAKHFSGDTIQRLIEYDWPGNVRQLENLYRRLAVVTPGREIGVQELPAFLSDPKIAARNQTAAVVPSIGAPLAEDSDDRWDESEPWTDALRRAIQRALRGGRPGVFEQVRERFDRTLLMAALELTGGHPVEAAKLLGIGRNTITRKLGSSRTRRQR